MDEDEIAKHVSVAWTGDPRGPVSVTVAGIPVDPGWHSAHDEPLMDFLTRVFDKAVEAQGFMRTEHLRSFSSHSAYSRHRSATATAIRVM